MHILLSTPFGDLFAYCSWGGLPHGGGPVPPTLRLFAAASPSVPWLEIATPNLDGTHSGSMTQFDLVWNGTAIIILGVTLNDHYNIGSSGGMMYLWEVSVEVATK